MDVADASLQHHQLIGPRIAVTRVMYLTRNALHRDISAGNVLVKPYAPSDRQALGQDIAESLNIGDMCWHCAAFINPPNMRWVRKSYHNDIGTGLFA